MFVLLECFKYIRFVFGVSLKTKISSSIVLLPATEKNNSS